MSEGTKIGLAVAGVLVVGYFVLGSSGAAAVAAAAAASSSGPLASPLGSSPGAVPPPIPAAGLAAHSIAGFGGITSDGGAAYNTQALAAGYPPPPNGMQYGQDGVTGQPVLIPKVGTSPFGLAHAALQSMTPKTVPAATPVQSSGFLSLAQRGGF
jgi:hypothetical protein